MTETQLDVKQKKEKLEKGKGGVGFKEINAIEAHCFHLCMLVSFVTKWRPALQSWDGIFTAVSADKR